MTSLTAEQLNRMDERLAERQNVLREELRDAAAHPDRYGDLSGEVPDRGDNAIADLITDLNSAEMSRDLEEFRQVQAARQRVRDGSYGDCLDCGLEIGYERLQACPTAFRCVICQGHYEKTHSTAPRASL
jgi:DnaK suppressor protein